MRKKRLNLLHFLRTKAWIYMIGLCVKNKLDALLVWQV